MTGRLVADRADPARRIAPLLVSTGISVTGDGAFLAAAPLLAATLTSSPVEVSAVTAGFYVPWIVAGLPAGVLVDRWPRRRVMIVADLVRVGALAVLAGLILAGLASVAVLVAAVLGIGIAQCFFDSAAQSVIPAVVGRDKEMLAHVNGRFWALDTIGRSLLGPPLGSATFALGQGVPFLADGASFLASAVLVRRLPAVPAQAGPPGGLKAAIGQGVRHVLRTPELAVLAVSAGAANFAFAAAMAVFVLYARDILDIPTAAYGLLIAAGAVGGGLAGWRAKALTRRLSHRQAMAISCLAQSVAWAGTALTANAWVAGALFSVAGATTALANVALGSAPHQLTPDNLLGRVTSTYRFIGVGAAGVGAIVGGEVASHNGLTAVLTLSAVCLLVNAVVTWPYRRRAPTANPDC